MLNKLKQLYYRILPYELRPSQLWYRTACFLWHRYTTIKPRTLGHEYCDKTTLLPHIIFEILCQFWKQEANNGWTDWEASNHTIDVNGEKVNVYKVWESAYKWWNTEYLPNVDKVYDKWHSFSEKHSKRLDIPLEDGNFELRTEWDSKANEIIGYKLFEECTKKEVKLEEELLNNMLLIIKTYRSMWT